MSAGLAVKRLHWTQRLALTRHNLHAASRTGDFTFFKTLQAHAFLEGTDYVAILTSILNHDADTVLHTLDDLNAGMAYVYQDAFKACYDNIRASVAEETHSRHAKIAVDVSQQKQVADFGIDKMANAAIALVDNQNLRCQEAVANVWLIGTTIITDVVQVCIIQMDMLESRMDDFILLEYSWQMVQTAVEASVSALRGVFNLMATSEPGSSMISGERSMSSASNEGALCRSMSVSSTTSSLFKKISTVLSHPSHTPVAPPSSARSSVSYPNPQSLRSSVSHSFPMGIPPPLAPVFHRKLSTIPPTPFEVNVNPFDMSFKRYSVFSQTHVGEQEPNRNSSETSSPYTNDFSLLDEQSPLDTDPIGSKIGTPISDCKLNNNPKFFRRVSRELDSNPIAV
jgi:hypothetical protein